MSMLRVTAPGIARYLDGAGGWDTLNCICGPGGAGTVAVTCEVYPIAPATLVSSSGATLTINGSGKSFNSASGTNPLTLGFSVGGDTSENSGDWNTVVITVMDNNGTQTSFTFYYYKSGASSTTTTTTTTTTTMFPTTSTTRLGAPTAKSAKGSLKPDKKYAKGKR